jgi:hypothetical protein
MEKVRPAIVLDFIEDKGLTNDQINNMYSA